MEINAWNDFFSHSHVITKVLLDCFNSTNLSNKICEILNASYILFYKWRLSQVDYWSTNWTQAVYYSSLEKLHGFHNRLCVCTLNIGLVFASKLFEMLQIVLLGLVLKSGSEWPHKKIYTFGDEWENSCKRSNSTHPLRPKMKHERSSGAAHIWLQRALTSAEGLPMAPFPPGFMRSDIHKPCLVYLRSFMPPSELWPSTSHLFSSLRAVLVFLSRRWRYSDGDTGCFGSCARWGPKGLPYIIHYALAHQTD